MTKMTKHRWTDEEVAVLRREYDGTTASKNAIAENLVLTAQQVQGKINTLGLAKRRKAPTHHWTEEERDVVRREYMGTHKSRADIAATLGVSVSAVAGEVARMGLANKTDRRRWTPAEEDQLRELLESKTVVQAAKILNRSENSVKVRATRINCSLRDRSGWYTKTEACEILGKDHKWVQRRIDDETLRATSHYGGRPTQLGQSAWHIKESDLRQFIRSNVHELDGRNVDLLSLVNVLVGIIV